MVPLRRMLTLSLIDINFLTVLELLEWLEEQSPLEVV